MRYVQCSGCTDSAQLGRLKADIVKSYRNGDLLVVQVNTPAVCLFRLKQYIIVKKERKEKHFQEVISPVTDGAHQTEQLQCNGLTLFSLLIWVQ